MSKEWVPSVSGRWITRSANWYLKLNGIELTLTVNGRVHKVNVEQEETYRIQAGLFWTDIAFYIEQDREVKVDGLPNVRGVDLKQALNSALAEKRLREDAIFIEAQRELIDRWLEEKVKRERACVQEKRWFTYEQQMALLALRPNVDIQAIRARMHIAGVAEHLRGVIHEIEQSLSAWESDCRPGWIALNEAHTKRELQACKELFDRVESRALTEEQARAVVCFDNRVQVVAAAGSGKTSTMVAKAAYAIHRGITTPERIVLLAFNKQAADELKDRASKALNRIGMAEVSVEAMTFHALGLRIIGKATKLKPDIPDWATDPAGGVRKLAEIVDQLKDRSPAFRGRWDLFRFVFGRDLPAFGKSGPADVWDAEGNGRLVTSKGERVKSLEEAMIANYLFLNGVEYQYEARYKHETADEDHRQYRPDFYYPELDLYHEHFALDAQGVPPSYFVGYMDGVVWKRKTHQEMGTSLFETTSHGLRSGNDFKRLGDELTSRGLVLDPNPDREIPPGGQKPMESAELIGLIRTFMSHVKSNSLQVEELSRRLDASTEHTFKHRHRLFLDIAGPVMEAWDAALVAEGGIDFEDMLNLAAEHLERNRCEMPYELVMADEFQDASRARARLCRALVKNPGKFFFAVGDDWQSINRFAGADVSVMSGFKKWFGHGQLLKLEQTFRCPQSLCDVSSTFVSKNPSQIPKEVRSTTSAEEPTLKAFQVDSKDKLAAAVEEYVMSLVEGLRNGTISPGRDGKVTVYVLGRYNSDRQYLPTDKHRFQRWVTVSFVTIHRSKGSEADYVILPAMISVLRGRSFPNTRADDPVLALAMPEGDSYPEGEERRLFYVALTRARRGVALFTVQGQCSSFVRELEEDGAVTITGTDGKSIKEESCPACKQGVLVLRSGPYGEFRSCSNYPSCSFKPKRRLSSAGVIVAPRVTQQERANRRPVVAPPVLPSEKASRLTISGVLKSINEGLADINRNVVRANAVASATSELRGNLNAERLVIEAALHQAKSAIDLQERLRDPLLRDAYQDSYQRFGALFASLDEAANQDSRRIDKPVPNFLLAHQFADSDTEAEIQRLIKQLREEREALLSVVHAQLTADPILRENFVRELHKLKGSHYLPALDPHSSWS